MLGGRNRRPRARGVRIARLQVDAVDDDNRVTPWLGRIDNGCKANRFWMRPDGDDGVVVATPGVVTECHASRTDKLFIEEGDAPILSGHIWRLRAGRYEWQHRVTTGEDGKAIPLVPNLK